MAHLRKRHALSLIKRRLKSSRVLTIQGARQTGKSVLARIILPTEFNNALFESFDSATTKRFAHDNPDTFLEKNKEYHSIIIDEAQIKESLTGRMSRIRLFPFTLA